MSEARYATTLVRVYLFVSTTCDGRRCAPWVAGATDSRALMSELPGDFGYQHVDEWGAGVGDYILEIDVPRELLDGVPLPALSACVVPPDAGGGS